MERRLRRSWSNRSRVKLGECRSRSCNGYIANSRIYVPDDGYLKRVHEVCKKHNVLLICDEIQTGLARTGKMYALDTVLERETRLLPGFAMNGTTSSPIWLFSVKLCPEEVSSFLVQVVRN
jgi:hypothetical protein